MGTGMAPLLGALGELNADLLATVTIRRQQLRIDQALQRSSHAAYHIGQIVFLAKQIRSGAGDVEYPARRVSGTTREAPTSRQAHRGAGPGSLDPAASDDDLVIVEDDRLTRGHGCLRLVELELGSAIRRVRGRPRPPRWR